MVVGRLDVICVVVRKRGVVDVKYGVVRVAVIMVHVNVVKYIAS